MAGDPHAAWRLFEERYRRLILATIRRLVPDRERVEEVYADVCAALAGGDLARLRRYTKESGAAVSTWLVVVVRNLAVDWLRRTEGRRRVSIPAGLEGLRRDIYLALCIEGLPPVEAYELARTRNGLVLSFPEFLREIRALRSAHPCPDSLPGRRPEPVPALEEIAVPSGDPAEVMDLARRLDAALATQPDDVRLAVQLFVVEELKASEVAALVGWPNPKAVYNRVRRALEAMREALEREGVRRVDL